MSSCSSRSVPAALRATASSILASNLAGAPPSSVKIFSICDLRSSAFTKSTLMAALRGKISLYVPSA